MTRKKYNYVSIVAGICLTTLGVFFSMEDQKPLAGVFLGVGISFAITGVIYIIIRYIEAKNPAVLKQNEIEQKDERIITIRNKAKAKAADINQWFIMGIAYLLMLIDAPLWMTGITVGVFLLYNVMSLVLIGKYSKEM